VKLNDSVVKAFLPSAGAASATGIATRPAEVNFPRHSPVNSAGGSRVLNTKAISENKLLSALEQTSLFKLLPFMERVNFPRDHYIFHPEDPVSHVYFPESGVVSEFQILEDGRTVEVAMTGRESAIGLSSVFDHRPASNWIQTIVGGSALRISVEILRNDFTRNESFQKICFEHINAYIRQISQRVVCQSYHSVEERFCAWLLMLHDRKQDGILPLTQEKIARLLGVHRPSITIIAKGLRDKAVLDYSRGQIYLKDRRKLEMHACACYSN
jgi:CRP-like cAMP-binding protein